MKKCGKCHKLKSTIEYFLDNSKKDKLSCYCKNCSKINRVKNYKYNPLDTVSRRKYYLKYKNSILLHNSLYRKKDLNLVSKYYSMRSRCLHKTSHNYKNYGGRGIKVLWSSYKDFKSDMYDSYIKHIEMYGIKNTTIERVDVNGNYCKENCCWATWKEQANNRR